MSSKKFKWYKIADTAADIRLTPGHIGEVEVEGKKLCVGQVGGEWYGFSHACPHAGASMMDGYVTSSCQVVCPVHQLKFNLKNGRDIHGDGYALKMYPIEVRAEGVFLGVEEASGFFGKLFGK